jgi:hypothetical protein
MLNHKRIFLAIKLEIINENKLKNLIIFENIILKRTQSGLSNPIWGISKMLEDDDYDKISYWRAFL